MAFEKPKHIINQKINYNENNEITNYSVYNILYYYINIYCVALFDFDHFYGRK